MKTEPQILPHGKDWNYNWLSGGFLVGALGQAIFLPCLCNIGTAKTMFAGVFDLLLLIRCIIAYSRKEKGDGWKFYTALVFTSPAWIEAGAWIAFRET
jgi:hypothetical protein